MDAPMGLVMYIFALVLFIIAAVPLAPTSAHRVNLVAAGLAFFVLGHIL